MKKPQWITIVIAVLATAAIFVFGRTVPFKSESQKTVGKTEDNHSHEVPSSITIDTILNLAKSRLDNSQVHRIEELENLLKDQSTSNSVKNDEEKLHVFHQLAGFWADSARVFEPYAWYTAEAARLENSEKKLTFAARLFLDNLQADEEIARRQWKALQAKDLFERSLKINPENDSAKVGIGAAYLFGNISEAPMEGILKIREVVEKDSTNIYAQKMLAKGSLISGQYDKAISRLQTVTRLDPKDLDATLLLAEVFERMNDKKNAVEWYQKSLNLSTGNDLKAAIQARIQDLKK